MSHPAYDTLAATWLRLHHFDHLQAIASWDRSALMPANGNAARANAMAEMNGLLHSIRTDPALAVNLDQAAGEPLNDFQHANLREIRRNWRMANALPASLVKAQSLANARCEHAWRTQRPANDWAGFLVNFRDVLKLAREQANRLADDTGLSPHDALMDNYEPGMTGAIVDGLFGDLQLWLPDLVRRVREKQARETVLSPVGPFPKAAQHAIGLEAMHLLGFDFDAGRLDESAHPFCGGVPEDTRLTTRYREDSFVGSLWGVIHATGH
ncbi:MAG: carboxypeptidase M32, partial [Pseudomonadota bacterium]